MSKLDASPESMRVELHEAEDSSFNEQSNVKEFDIVLEEKGVGEAALGLHKDDGEVDIDLITIREQERKKGYSNQVVEALISHVLRNYKWAHTIISATDSLPMMKANRSASVPDGWRRTFLLNARKPENEDVNELFTPIGETDDPEEAINCVEQGGSVTMALEKINGG